MQGVDTRICFAFAYIAIPVNGIICFAFLYFAIPADTNLLNAYVLNGYASHGYVLVG